MWYWYFLFPQTNLLISLPFILLPTASFVKHLLYWKYQHRLAAPKIVQFNIACNRAYQQRHLYGTLEFTFGIFVFFPLCLMVIIYFLVVTQLWLITVIYTTFILFMFFQVCKERWYRITNIVFSLDTSFAFLHCFPDSERSR